MFYNRFHITLVICEECCGIERIRLRLSTSSIMPIKTLSAASFYFIELGEQVKSVTRNLFSLGNNQVYKRSFSKFYGLDIK